MKNIKRSSHSQSGFTLVEVMIAIILLSFLMISVYSIVDNASNTIYSVTREDRDFIQIETAMARMDQDFNQIYSPLYFSLSADDAKSSTPQNRNPEDDIPGLDPTLSVNFPLKSAEGLRIPFFDGDKKSFTFFTSSNRKRIPNSKESRYAWVRYSLRSMENDEREDKKGSEELIRQISPIDPYIDEVIWDQIRPQVLLKNVESLSFEYWDKKNKKFVDALQRLDNPLIVRAIRVSLNRFDINGHEQELIRIFRPLWPYFDTRNDLQRKNGSSSATTPPITSSPENSEQGFSD